MVKDSTLQMMLFYASILLLTLVAHSPTGVSSTLPCYSPQYIELSKTGILNCVFDENFFAVYWYNSTDYSQEPFLFLKEGITSGVGYASGEFDISQNGSLIITNVSLSHDHTFTAIKLNSSKDDFIPHVILAVVTVKPNTGFPIISKCGNARSTCFMELDYQENISCSVRGVRPGIPLQWMSRTVYGDRNVSYNAHSFPEGYGVSTYATVNHIFTTRPDFALLVCASRNLWSSVSFDESMIIVQNINLNDELRPSVTKLVNIGSELRLTGTEEDFTFLVWKKKSTEDQGVEIPLAIFTGADSVKESLVEDYHVSSDGSLIVPQSKLHHDGIYVCLFGNGLEYGLRSYEVLIYVIPEPPHPIVDGCQHQNNCILEIQSEGYLTCRLFGIRPAVNLEWNTYPRTESSKLTFLEHSRETKYNGDLYDLSVTSKYRLNDVMPNRITAECSGSKTNESFFKFQTKIELLFLDTTGNSQTEANLTLHTKFSYTILMTATILIVSFIGVTLCIIVKVLKVKSRNRYEVQTPDIEEGEEEEEMALMFQNTGQLSDKRCLFIKELKSKYEELCAGVHPVPFIRNKLFRINKVFVESEIELLLPLDETHGRQTWERLNSYKELFVNEKVKSKRYILEGGPGYGKSTLALQLAYDWCHQENDVGLFEVFILLRLRQLGKCMSIYKAIKHLLLPEDSQLSENDVCTILRSCKSVLMVLDGYDEYISYHSEVNADIRKILNREKLQQFDVLLTTRVSCLPKTYAPLTKRLRLTGFNENARDTYIFNVVANDTESGKLVKECLNQNPVLSDLCQVPLFFVMFAHVSHERPEFEKFTSVTSFFQYVIDCIHFHMLRKLEMGSKEDISSEHCEIDHSKLDELAFNSLAERGQHTLWTKENILQQVGKDCFENFINNGILFVEDVFSIAGRQVSSNRSHVHYIEKVQFYHELFCEWYAAHYLSKIVTTLSTQDLNKQLKNINPYQRQYVYRFACGLNTSAGNKLIQYLEHINVSDEIIILCVVEQTGNYKNIMATVTDLCSKAIELRNDDSRMMQRAILQLLEIASTNQVSVSCLRFRNWFYQPTIKISEIDQKSITQIEIYENDRKLEEKDVKIIIDYISKISKLESVKFFECLMPISLKCCQSISFQVLWYTRLGTWYVFDTLSSQWKEKSGSAEALTLSCYEKLVEQF